MKWKYTIPKHMECSKKQSRGKFIAIYTYIKKRKNLNKQSNLTPQGTRKVQSQQKDRSNKSKAEMNDQITVNINETKSQFFKKNEADKTLATNQ